MDKDFFIRLTLGVYKVTDLFPEKEPLKFSLREKANEVLADSIILFAVNPPEVKRDEVKVSELLRNIEILKGYFEIVGPQKWLDEKNFLILKNEYERLQKEIAGLKIEEGNFPTRQNVIKEKKAVVPIKAVAEKEKISERAKKIIDFLKTREKVQVWEIKQILPEVTKRTLRRDFDELLERGLVERVGEGKNTFYRTKDNIETKII